jgi:hypothetical protein
MAIPRKLLAPNVPLGDDSFEKRVVDLYAASANSQTKYSSGDRLLFQIPNYQRSFLDMSKSFLKFDLKVTTNAGAVRVQDGLPIFERMQVRVGAKSIEDIDSYYTLEKIMNNLTKTTADKELMGDMYGDHSDEDATVGTLQTNTNTYLKKLYSGVLGNEQYLFPIHRLNTGNALEIELTLANNAIAMKKVTGVPTDFSYEISNVKFQFCLLKVSDAFFNKYNSLANSNELVLPMTTYRRHISNIGENQPESVVFVTDNSKNLKRTYTVFRQNPSTTGTITQPNFLKGEADTANKLLRYQYKYMSRNFPESPVEVTSGNHNVFLANVLTNSKHSLTERIPAIVGTYETDFMLVQDFTYSDDEIINGLNINASGSPLILELKFNGTGVATSVETFTESSIDLVLDSSGNASIVQKTKMGAE